MARSAETGYGVAMPDGMVGRRRAPLKSLTLAIAAILGSSAPALAVGMLESDFQVSYTYAGQDYTYSETDAPMLPGNTCYDWYIHLDDAAATPTVEERFVLPSAVDTWGEAKDNPDDGIEIEEGGKVAVSTFAGEPDADGWINGGWCAAEGDPLGAYRFEVSLDGVHTADFDFHVVAPEDYQWPPVRQSEPFERSVDNNW